MYCFRRGILSTKRLYWRTTKFNMLRMSTFFILFSLIYFPVAILIGRFEFKKGTTMRRPFLAPYTQDTIESNILMRRSLMHYYNGETEDAMKDLVESEKLLVKWKYES